MMKYEIMARTCEKSENERKDMLLPTIFKKTLVNNCWKGSFVPCMKSIDIFGWYKLYIQEGNSWRRCQNACKI